MSAIVSGVPILRSTAVTRLLCGALYLDPDFADTSYRDLCIDKILAVGPSPGVDLVAVARHSRNARRKYRTRLITLTACAMGLIVAAIGGLSSIVLTPHRLLLPSLVLFLIFTMVAWLSDGLFTLWWKRTAQRLITQVGREPREQAAPISEDRERVLRDVAEANVVIYPVAAEKDPFIGAGVLVAQKNWRPIDISRPMRDRNGERERRPFTVNDLIQSLAERFPQTGLKQVSVQEVLYVRGDIVQRIPVLRAEAHRPPSSVIPDVLLRKAARSIEDGVRSYLRVQVVGPDAHIAVTMNVRATIIGRQLTFHVVVHVLPPLHEHYRTAQYVDANTFLRIMKPFIKRPVTVLQDLRAAPARLFWQTVADYRAAARVRQARRIVRRAKYAYDFGDRLPPIRMRVCDPRRMTNSDESDAVDWLQRMSRALLDATEEFLRDHNINTADLRRNRDTIINTTYNIESVKDSNLGDYGTVINDSSDDPKGDK